jgi:hypothetical protein
VTLGLKGEREEDAGREGVRERIDLDKQWAMLGVCPQEQGRSHRLQPQLCLGPFGGPRARASSRGRCSPCSPSCSPSNARRVGKYRKWLYRGTLPSFGACEVPCWRWLFGNKMPISSPYRGTSSVRKHPRPLEPYGRAMPGALRWSESALKPLAPLLSVLALPPSF